MELQVSKMFKKPYISIGSWNFKNKTNFSKCDYVSADTETKIFLNGKHASDEEIYQFYKECTTSKASNKFNPKTIKTFRSSLEVIPYAFTISDGINFALFQCLEDFLTCITYMRVKYIIWYNAKFDFTFFDYYFIWNDWNDYDNLDIRHDGLKHAIPPQTYQSLNGDFGQRYQMKIWNSYYNNSRHLKTHKIIMVDLCNVLGGGLKKNLENFDIRDEDDHPIRKLEMDYVEADITNDEDIHYMVNDVKGLHRLALKFDGICKELSGGYSIFNGDYMTAGGLAKKVMLKYMFKMTKDKDNVKTFKYYFPMNAELDNDLRKQYLYKGGLCQVNKYYKGKVVHNVYKYDINSMYPDKLRNMKLPFGNPVVYTPEKLTEYRNDKCYILKLKYLYGEMKENMIPIYMDCLSNDFVEDIFEDDGRLIWLEELEMLSEYYNLYYEIDYILEFKAVYSKGLREFIDTFYSVKSNTTNKSMREVVKLFLNSSYGKLAQRPNEYKIKYEIDEDGGYLKTERYVLNMDERGENQLLSIYVGSRVTALARVNIAHFILKITQNNPKKYFIYMDTDSVHSLIEFKDTDDKELGKMKFEGLYENAIYLAPKTYLMENKGEYEVHSKGVNTDVIRKEITKCKNFDDVVNHVFKAGVKFKCLNCMNVIGGRALFYVDKVILNELEQGEQELLNLSALQIKELK